MGISTGISMGILIRCQPATLLCVNFLQQRRGADGYPPLRLYFALFETSSFPGARTPGFKATAV
jgi:hypothetical protein